MPIFDGFDRDFFRSQGVSGATLGKLTDAEARSDEVDRIKRAIRDGLLPGVTMERANAIEKGIDRELDAICHAIDKEGNLG